MRLKQPRLPLEQITRRLAELSLDYDQLFDRNSTENSFETLKSACEIDGVQVSRQLTIDSGCMLSATRSADSWFLTKKFEIVKMKYAKLTNNGIVIHGFPINVKESFFTQPVSSTYLNVFQSDGILKLELAFRFKEILAKMICISSGDKFIFLPLLHTLKKY